MTDETDETYELERDYKVWNNKTGECIEVRPSRDGFDGYTEIVQKFGSDKSGGAAIGILKEQMPLLIEALQSRLADMELTNDT